MIARTPRTSRLANDHCSAGSGRVRAGRLTAVALSLLGLFVAADASAAGEKDADAVELDGRSVQMEPRRIEVERPPVAAPDDHVDQVLLGRPGAELTEISSPTLQLPSVLSPSHGDLGSRPQRVQMQPFVGQVAEHLDEERREVTGEDRLGVGQPQPQGVRHGCRA